MSDTRRTKIALAFLSIAVIGGVGVWGTISGESPVGPVSDASRLVSIQEFSALEACAWDDLPVAGSGLASADSNLMASLRPENIWAALRPSFAQPLMAAPFQMDPNRTRFSQGNVTPLEAVNEVTRDPVFRTLADTYPTYTSVGVNLQTDEVILSDNNLWSVRVFDRLDNTPPGADLTEAKRVIQGDETGLQYTNGAYVDPNNGDVYLVESDTGDKMVVFGSEAGGNVAPKRTLYTPHRVYAIAVDEEREELYVTVEYPPSVVVYSKDAAAGAEPLRRIKGDRTLLATPHGIAVDTKNQLLYVNNWGQTVSFDDSPVINACCRDQPVETGRLGTGKFVPPSITVYALDAEGDTPPLRVIQGDRTRLNWPSNMAVNPDNGDLYVANDVDQSVLVFTGMTYVRGNVPPTRVIKGDQTGLVYPTGVAVDTTNQELWVANLGNASATAYPLMADGNVAPLRVIRSAPQEHASLTFGRTAAVAYDRNREEILVPN